MTKGVIAELKFRGFTAQIVPNDDRPGVNCFVSKGKFCSSLALAEDLGHIEHNFDLEEPLEVPKDVLNRIGIWARKFDY